MIASLGHVVTLLALCGAVLGAVVSFYGGLVEHPGLVTWGRRAAFVVCVLVTFAVVLMEVALVTHDFSVKFVADVGSRQTPLYYTIISLWGALEGSILLWMCLLSLYTVVFLLTLPHQFLNIEGYATGILLTISTFFLYVIVGPGNPFVRLLQVPVDGPGPNPLLQNHPMMGLHPPLVYLGYVGLSIPFSIAVASLLRGVPSPDIFRLIRRWSLLPWVFLSLGITAGMWWSYAVLGWGGYWSWDPVENASLMPWLVTTAFLHSLQVQERRQMLKTWTVSLIIGAFLLSILGTFLTRSGIVASVHAFTQSAIGPTFLSFLTAVLVGSVGLLIWRGRELAAPGALEAVICRETVFLLNNLLLVAATFTILLGTLFPLIAEATQGTQLSVGAPYFNHVNVPIGLAILFLMGVGPVLPWGAARMVDLQYRLLYPVAFGVLIILLLLAIGVRGAGPLVAFGMAAFVLGITLSRLGIDIRARVRSTGEGYVRASRHLLRANPRRYGGYLSHVGILLAITGIAASQAYGIRAASTLHPGQSMHVGSYTLTFRGLRPRAESNRMVLAADVQASRSGTVIGNFLPSQNVYQTMQQPVVTPAVREEPFHMFAGLLQGRNPFPEIAPVLTGQNPLEDLYIVLQAVDTQNANQHNANRSVTLQVLVNPMVGLIWLGGLIVGLGGACAVAPQRRRRSVINGAAEAMRLQPEEMTV